MNRLPSTVDHELGRHHPLVEHELQTAIGPADGGEPPRLVEQVGRAADLLPCPDAVADGRGIAEAPVLLEHRKMLPAPLHVVVESAGRKDHAAACADAPRSAIALDHRADDRAVDVGDQLRHRRVQPQRDAMFLHRQPETRSQRLSDRRHPVTEHPRPEHPPDQLQQDGFTPPVLPDLVEQPKILGGEPDSLRAPSARGCSRFCSSSPSLRRSMAGTLIVLPSSEPPGSSGIVVGVAGLPDELEPPAALLEELHHLRR